MIETAEARGRKGRGTNAERETADKRRNSRINNAGTRCAVSPRSCVVGVNLWSTLSFCSHDDEPAGTLTFDKYENAFFVFRLGYGVFALSHGGDFLAVDLRD